MSTELLINGWPLMNEGIGMGVHAGRVVRSLLARRSELICTPRVVVPSWMTKLKKLPYEVEALSVPRLGKDIIDQAVWSQRLGHYASGRGSILFSPVPFWSTVAPRRTVVCQLDRIYHHFPRYLGRLGVRRWLLGRSESFLRRCSSVLTLSEHARRDIAEIPGLDAARIIVTRCWLTDEFSQETARESAARVREKYKLPEAYWLYVGGYDYRKNVELLLEAYARAPNGRPPLVLAGCLPARRGPYCDVAGTLRRLAFPNGQVITPGYIESDDMPGLYGGASLFIYPSRYEGFGLPPMEAMGCGCPAICSNNSSLPEIVRDAAYRFRDDDAGELTALLAQAVRQPLTLNPSFSRQDFDDATSAQKHIELFNRLARS